MFPAGNKPDAGLGSPMRIAQTSRMVPFKPIPGDEPALAHAPILKAALLTFDYVDQHGPIGLTPAKALKRYFVQWAAEAFAWPRYTAKELYVVDKVLNEADFPPLTVVHDVLLAAKLARHYKGTLRLTANAKRLRNKPGELWGCLATTLLYGLDHRQYTRFGDAMIGNWDVFLNVINVEADHAMSEERLFTVLFGAPETDIWTAHYRLASTFYLHVLRPLCWAGLLAEHDVGEGFAKQVVFTKTPLWAAVFTLETDRHLQPPTRH
jgi:hypothetical protein